jgi:hypothetical protein
MCPIIIALGGKCDLRIFHRGLCAPFSKGIYVPVIIALVENAICAFSTAFPPPFHRTTHFQLQKS